jgi:large subunit ribosomal protein L10
MAQEKKSELVSQLADMLGRNNVVLATDYRGLTVAQMSQLRRQLRAQGYEYRVVKNTLTSLAAERVGKLGLCGFLKEPTALAFGNGNEAQLAKVILNYQREAKTSLSIKGGLLYEQVLSSKEISTLATLPPKDVLLAKLTGTLHSPIYSLLNVLTAEMRALLAMLQGRIKQLEGG